MIVFDAAFKHFKNVIISEPINTFHSSYKTDNEPIRLSYHSNVHYNGVIDPYKQTIGVGLGLPVANFQPGVRTFISVWKFMMKLNNIFHMLFIVSST